MKDEHRNSISAAKISKLDVSIGDLGLVGAQAERPILQEIVGSLKFVAFDRLLNDFLVVDPANDRNSIDPDFNVVPAIVLLASVSDVRDNDLLSRG
jgi:hypothetical protein